MAVRKQSGKRLQRVRAYPNIVNWWWTTKPELVQKLSRFEKSLKTAFDDLGDLLLSVVDGTRTPDYKYTDIDTLKFEGDAVSLTRTRDGYITVTINDTTTFGGTPSTVGTSNAAGSGPAAAYFDHVHDHGAQSTSNHHATLNASRNGFAPSTSGASTGDYLAVQGDGTSNWETPFSGDHGALTGLGDDDHTQYLLVSGARALGGNWSLGNFDLSNANVVTFNGVGSGIDNIDLIQFRATGGGSITNLDDLTMFDSGAFIDMNQGSITDVWVVENTASGMTIRTTDGNINVDANGVNRDVNITADDEIDLTAGGAVDINSVGAITLDTSAGTIFVRANGAGGDVNVEAVDQIDMLANILDLNGTSGITLDTVDGNINLTAAGVGRDINLDAPDEINLIAGSFVDFNATPAHNVEYLELDDGDSMSGEPSAGHLEIGAFSGADSSNPGGMIAAFSSLFLWEFPIANELDNSASASDTLVSTINFASVRGYDLTDRVIRVRVHLQSMRTDSDDSNYGTQDSEVEFTINTNVSGNAQAGERDMEGIVNASPFDPVVIRKYTAPSVGTISTITAVSTSGTTVVFTGSITGTGTRRANMTVEIKYCYI